MNTIRLKTKSPFASDITILDDLIKGKLSDELYVMEVNGNHGLILLPLKLVIDSYEFPIKNSDISLYVQSMSANLYSKIVHYIE
jgi:hypothetical protein